MSSVVSKNTGGLGIGVWTAAVVIGITVVVFTMALRRSDTGSRVDEAVKAIPAELSAVEKPPRSSASVADVDGISAAVKAADVNPQAAIQPTTGHEASSISVAIPEPLPEMKQLLESPSMAGAPVQNLRARLEQSSATPTSQVLEEAMKNELALSTQLMKSPTEAMTNLATCRESVCELQVAIEKPPNLQDAVGDVSAALDAVDKAMMSHGMVRGTQASIRNPNGSFLVTYWIPRSEFMDNLRNSSR